MNSNINNQHDPSRHYFPKDWWPLLIYVISIAAAMLVTIMYVRIDIAVIKEKIEQNHTSIKEQDNRIKDLEIQLNSLEQSLAMIYRNHKTK